MKVSCQQLDQLLCKITEMTSTRLHQLLVSISLDGRCQLLTNSHLGTYRSCSTFTRPHSHVFPNNSQHLSWESPQQIEEFQSPEGPPDVSAIPMTEEQKARTYKSSLSWNAASDDLPPLGGMKGMSYFRRSIKCDSKAEYERYRSRFDLFRPPSESNQSTKLLDLLPETMERMSFSSNGTSSSASTASGAVEMVYDYGSKREAFTYRKGFAVASRRSESRSEIAAFRKECREKIFNPSVSPALSSDASAGSGISEGTTSMNHPPMATQSPCPKSLSVILDVESCEEMAAESASLESTLSSFEVQQLREASNRRRLNPNQPSNGPQSPAAIHPDNTLIVAKPSITHGRAPLPCSMSTEKRFKVRRDRRVSLADDLDEVEKTMTKNWHSQVLRTRQLSKLPYNPWTCRLQKPDFNFPSQGMIITDRQEGSDSNESTNSSLSSQSSNSDPEVQIQQPSITGRSRAVTAIRVPPNSKLLKEIVEVVNDSPRDYEKDADVEDFDMVEVPASP